MKTLFRIKKETPPSIELQFIENDLNRWKLTLPTGKPGSPTEIFAPQLLTYSDSNVIRNETMITLKCPTTGVTTSSTAYPRCELREMNGPALANWDGRKGSHQFTFTGSIDVLPTAKPQLVFGQIHNDKDDVIELRVTKNDKTCIYEVIHNTTHFGNISADYVLGSDITVTIMVSGGNVTISSGETKLVIPQKKLPQLKGSYFKLGSYVQSNPAHGDGEGQYGQTTIKATSIKHF